MTPAKRDANHAEIAQALRTIGCRVIDLAAKRLSPDLLARRPWWLEGVWLGIEIKASDDARLTPEQKRMLADGSIVVVRTVQQAIDAMSMDVVEARR